MNIELGTFGHRNNAFILQLNLGTRFKTSYCMYLSYDWTIAVQGWGLVNGQFSLCVVSWTLQEGKGHR